MDIYQEQIRDIFGTTDLNQLRQYAAQLKSVPSRFSRPSVWPDTRQSTQCRFAFPGHHILQSAYPAALGYKPPRSLRKKSSCHSEVSLVRSP